MDTYSGLRHFADSWGLLAMTLFFVGTILWAFRPGSAARHRDSAAIPFRHDARPAVAAGAHNARPAVAAGAHNARPAAPADLHHEAPAAFAGLLSDKPSCAGRDRGTCCGACDRATPNERT
jgi:cytochrome c oxidase cbb3-type subunit 4